MIIGAGWTIHHLTDRVIELRKDSYEYRRLTGRDGFVRVRAEPGMDRAQIIDRAIQQARKSDDALSFRLANDLMPTARGAGKYRDTLRKLTNRFATPEDPELIGVKRA